MRFNSACREEQWGHRCIRLEVSPKEKGNEWAEDEVGAGISSRTQHVTLRAGEVTGRRWLWRLYKEYFSHTKTKPEVHHRGSQSIKSGRTHYKIKSKTIINLFLKLLWLEGQRLEMIQADIRLYEGSRYSVSALEKRAKRKLIVI